MKIIMDKTRSSGVLGIILFIFKECINE